MTPTYILQADPSEIPVLKSEFWCEGEESEQEIRDYSGYSEDEEF